MTSPRSLVLVADNDPHVSQVLRIFLERAGLAVETAPDGRAALLRIQAGGVDCLVCDLDMPEISGEVLIERLAAAAPPTVVVSGYVDQGMEARVRRNPAVRAVLRKPFDLTDFARLVAGLARPAEGGARGGGLPGVEGTP